MKDTVPAESSGSRLQLHAFETRSTRLFFIQVTSEQLDTVLQSAALHVGGQQRDLQIWERLVKDDLVVCIGESLSTGHNRCAALQVLGKSIKTSDHLLNPDERPFVIWVRILGTVRRSSLPWDAYFINSALADAPRYLFQHLFENCSPAQDNRQTIQDHLYESPKGVNVRLAETREDFRFITQLGSTHPFGYRRATINLIAEQNGALCGAALAELGSRSTVSHNACWRVFRNDYPWIRSRALRILRILVAPRVHSRWNVQRALFRAILEIAPSVVPPPVTIVEGVSYDYHPIAVESGFEFELPESPVRSFYYWKPLNIPVKTDAVVPIDEKMRMVHELIRERSSIAFWLVSGSNANVELGLEKSAWALAKSAENNGRWRCVRQDHVVFLMSNDRQVHAYGYVDRTAHREVKTLERYPLWMDLTIVSGKRHPYSFDVSTHLREAWFQRLAPAGIYPLPNEFGAWLKEELDNQERMGRMWVQPNPYLLHRTEFETISGRVFVVQAWSLRETVLPSIKETLQAEGYTVVYSGDRDGQVVFDDIWVMLNEAEIVVVDFTDRRPNVYLEYGMALVLGKPIIAISQRTEDMPSDTPNLKCIFYHDRMGDAALKKHLPSAAKDITSDLQRFRERTGNALRARLGR